MSQIYKSIAGGGGGGSAILSLTGNNAVPVFPTANNIDIVGTGDLLVTGNATDSTLSISSLNPFQTGTATTTDGVTYVPFSITANIPLPIPNTVVSIRANLAGIDIINGIAIGGELIGAAKNIAGVVTIVGIPDLTRNNDVALSAWTADLGVSGTNVQVQVRGVTGHTIQWRTNLDYVIAP